ncbi:MAG: hypothetical protein KDA65_03070 [Planctomycetaceae bacterium]|nr:hypothetical protein [Planctomycetaceae bacterium]
MKLEIVFGVKNPLAELLNQSWLLYTGLIVAVCFLIWVIIQVRTRLRDDADHNADPWQLLQQMQDLHRQGDLTEEEYRSIKGQLLSKNEELLPQSAQDNSKQSIKEDCPDETSDEQEARE